MGKQVGRDGRAKARRVGFTLVELMVVVAIIGILAAIGVPRLIAYARTSETSEVAQHAGRIANAIAAYAESQGVSARDLAAQIHDKPVTVDRTATDLSNIIPLVSLAPDANFDYKVQATVADQGPLAGGLALCIKATGRATSGVVNGIVVFSNAATTAAGWQGRVNRVPYLNGGAGGLTAGGHCTNQGSVQANCTDCRS